jgi:hypothetical protein
VQIQSKFNQKSNSFQKDSVDGSNKTYFLSELKLNWIEAQLTCRSYGMNLLEIADSEEFSKIKDIYKQNKTSFTGQTYIGGSNLFKKPWHWIGSGKPMTLNHTEWNTGGPDGQHVEEYCTAILRNSAKEFVINDVPCRSDQYTWEFICEKIEKEKSNKQQEKLEMPNSSHAQTYIIITFLCLAAIVCIGAQFLMIRGQNKKNQREDEMNIL